MDRIDFYKTSNENYLDILLKLVSKLNNLPDSCFIYTKNSSQSKIISDYIWTHKKNSWFNNTCEDLNNSSYYKFLINDNLELSSNRNFFINLSDDLDVSLIDCTRYFDVFIGNNSEHVKPARIRWKEIMYHSKPMYYWQEYSNGWKLKAEQNSS